MLQNLDLYSLIYKIPATFWGVVIGSFFSILGVTLSNRASDKRLRDQFDHERVQKTKEREMTIRKEVFLDAAEAVHAGINAISRFANLDISNDAVTKDFVERSPSIAKIHVIAKTSTVIAMTNLSGELSSVYLKLFAKRYELQVEKNKIQLLDNQIADFGRERDRFLELLKQYNVEGLDNARRWNAIQGNFDFEQKRILDSIDQRNKLMNALLPLQLEFTRECVNELARVSELVFPLLTEVRKELELPFDEILYRDAMEHGKLKQKEALDNFIQKFMPKTK